MLFHSSSRRPRYFEMAFAILFSFFAQSRSLAQETISFILPEIARQVPSFASVVSKDKIILQTSEGVILLETSATSGKTTTKSISKELEPEGRVFLGCRSLSESDSVSFVTHGLNANAIHFRDRNLYTRILLPKGIVPSFSIASGKNEVLIFDGGPQTMLLVDSLAWGVVKEYRLPPGFASMQLASAVFEPESRTLFFLNSDGKGEMFDFTDPSLPRSIMTTRLMQANEVPFQAIFAEYSQDKKNILLMSNRLQLAVIRSHDGKLRGTADLPFLEGRVECQFLIMSGDKICIGMTEREKSSKAGIFALHFDTQGKLIYDGNKRVTRCLQGPSHSMNSSFFIDDALHIMPFDRVFELATQKQ